MTEARGRSLSRFSLEFLRRKSKISLRTNVSIRAPRGGGQKGIEGGEAGEKGPFEPDTGVDCKQSHFRQTSKCDIA